jgi:predicted DsbA family dithiol-disulfide isomerase
MLIEIYSDTTCPWCFIGMRRLARARAMRPDVAIENLSAQSMDAG